LARWTSKEMVLNISGTKEAIMFLEALQKQVKIVDIIADYYPGKVNIRFEGTKDNLQEAIDITKRIHLITKNMLYPDENGLYQYDIEHLSRVTGKTFPIKVLLKIITLNGQNATRDENELITDLDFTTIKKIIQQIDEKMSEMPYEVSTGNLRDAVTIIAVVENITAENAVALARKKAIIEEDELQRLTLKYELEQALEKCLNIKN
jgi:hypothetical protein